VKVCVLINDTVGTLMSTAYYDRKTSVGLILGTGTNAAYFEKTERIGTLDANSTVNADEVSSSKSYEIFFKKKFSL
jgi:hexokinase